MQIEHCHANVVGDSTSALVVLCYLCFFMDFELNFIFINLGGLYD